MPVLSPVAFFLPELGGASPGHASSPYKDDVDVCSVANMLRAGNAKQALSGHVARRACAVYLVAARNDRMERWSTACSIPAHFSACERLDNLGTEISCKRSWSGVGTDLARASDHGRTSDMVLPGQTCLASSAHFHLPEVGDSFMAMDGVPAVAGSNAWFVRLMGAARKSWPRFVLYCGILCRLAVSGARLFQCLFLSLLVCKRSLPIPGEHGAACVSWRYHQRKLSPVNCSSVAGSSDGISAAGTRQYPVVFAYDVNVAANYRLPRPRNFVHKDPRKESWLLDGPLQPWNRSSR